MTDYILNINSEIGFEDFEVTIEDIHIDSGNFESTCQRLIRTSPNEVPTIQIMDKTLTKTLFHLTGYHSFIFDIEEFIKEPNKYIGKKTIRVQAITSNQNGIAIDNGFFANGPLIDLYCNESLFENSETPRIVNSCINVNFNARDYVTDIDATILNLGDIVNIQIGGPQLFGEVIDMRMLLDKGDAGTIDLVDVIGNVLTDETQKYNYISIYNHIIHKYILWSDKNIDPNRTSQTNDNSIYTNIASFRINMIKDVNLKNKLFKITQSTNQTVNEDAHVPDSDNVPNNPGIGSDPVINPFFGSGYKVKLPDLPGHIYRLLQGGGITINAEIMACPVDKASILHSQPVLFFDQIIIEGTYIGKILIDINDISFRHTIDLSQETGCLVCILPNGAYWDGGITDGEQEHGMDPDYKGKYKQRILSVGGVMNFVIRIYEHPQVQNEFQVLRCNIDPSVHDGLLMKNYKPKLFILNDLCDTRILYRHKKNSNPLTFRHPVVKNQVNMKCI